MLVLLHCFKMEQKLNTAEGSKINTNPKIQIRVNSKRASKALANPTLCTGIVVISNNADLVDFVQKYVNMTKLTKIV